MVADHLSPFSVSLVTHVSEDFSGDFGLGTLFVPLSFLSGLLMTIEHLYQPPLQNSAVQIN